MLAVLARLGDTDARIDAARLDRWARLACVLALCIYALHGVYAVITHRALYGDAAWFLLRMISEGDVTSFYTDFSREFYYSRFVAYAMTQLPALAALHLGIDDARMLSWILGATYFIHKPLSLLLCYRLLPTGRKGYVLFPLLGLFAGSINSEIYIVTETHLATSFLWPMLIAVTQMRQPGRVAWLVIAGALLLSAFVYESMAFFGPLLLAVCLIRAERAQLGRRVGWVVLSVCALVPIAVNWAAILFPRDPTNKSAFSNGVMKLVDDSLSGIAAVHVLGFVSLLSLLAIVLLLGQAVWRARDGRDVPAWTWFVALALAAVPVAHFVRYASQVDFTYAITDRGFGGLVMQVAVIGLYVLVLMLPARVFQTAAPGALVVASGLAIGQVGWQMLATHAWYSAVGRLESTLARGQGLGNCTSTTLSGGAIAAEPDPAGILCHWWILPLSVVLSQDSGVRALLVSDEPFLPFDPRMARALPNTPEGSINYRPYLQVLARERAAPLPGSLDFTDAGNGSRYLRAGFSTPEGWATWTDGRVAKLELCFAPGNSNPLLTFKVAPQLTGMRPRLGVALEVNGAHVDDWAFRLGEGVVERSLAIPRGRLDAKGCAVIGFTFDDDRRASEIGVPDDPRRLGLAFVSMQARY